MLYRPEEFVKDYRKFENSARVEKHGEVSFGSTKYPLVSVTYGNPTGPALVISGGVHGLERIGAQLALSLLNSFQERVVWDAALGEILKKIQVVFMPLVNPVGYFETRRGNANGVDLMRNAPVEADEKVPFLLGGHYHTNKIHWYRGREVQTESQFVFECLKSVLSRSPAVVSLDFHSGFGFKDQLWFPFANSKKTFSQLEEMYLLFELFEKSHPHHLYVIEPQSKNYLTHGYFWEYCYYNFKRPDQVYLPLTLEMGSWIWVKKNPLQIFSKTGLFNPMKEHRMNRTLRRHRPLFDFLIHALYSFDTWTVSAPANKTLITEEAIKKYYGHQI